jgi:HEAT repeat protein
MDERKQILVKSLRDKDEHIRSAAAEALERLEGRGRITALTELLSKGSKVEKLKSIYALGCLRGQDVTDILVVALKDPVEDIRASSLRVLGLFADNKVLPHIVERLKDESPLVGRVAIEALTSYREPQVLGSIMQMLKSKDSGVVERAIRAVCRSGDKRAEKAMLYFASKGNINMRQAALEALGVMER